MECFGGSFGGLNGQTAQIQPDAAMTTRSGAGGPCNAHMLAAWQCLEELAGQAAHY